MDKKKLEQRAQEIIAELELESKDGGLTFIDLNTAYNKIIALAKEHAREELENYPL